MKNIRVAKATFDDRESGEISPVEMSKDAIEKSEREIRRLQKELAEKMAKNGRETAA